MFTGFFDQPRRNGQWLHPGGPLQWDWELEAMLAMFQDAKPRRVVEIGCFEGYTLEAMAKAAPPGASLLGIDPEVGRINWQERSGLRRSDVKVQVVNERSDHPSAVAAAQAIAPLDWLFIDGDHSYEGARFDFETYGLMVAPGGIIALHDIYPSKAEDIIQVHRLWADIVLAGYVTRKLVCAKTPTLWGGIGLVYVGA